VAPKLANQETGQANQAYHRKHIHRKAERRLPKTQLELVVAGRNIDRYQPQGPGLVDRNLFPVQERAPARKIEAQKSSTESIFAAEAI
jgi:hypothetical protein